MNELQFKEKFGELIENENFQEKLKGLKERDAINKLFLENGLGLTDEMLDGIMEKITYYDETGEFDAETLEFVAGGGWKGFAACIGIGAGVGALSGGGYGAIAGAVIGGVTYFVLR